MRTTSVSRPRQTAPSSRSTEPAPIDPDLIANLSDQNILDMEADELLRVIKASNHPWRAELSPSQIACADLETLRRMAFKARLCCRNALAGNTGEQPDIRRDESGIWLYGVG